MDDVQGTTQILRAGGMVPAAATVELVPDSAVVPLEDRLRVVRRRRQLVTLRAWAAVLATVCGAAGLVAIGVLAFMAH